ncbi:PIN domain-containing protein [Ochrobactrum sp. CGA5]|uniref:PIN domain-containing protein n=1 Tax=Ochrobactrum sp. CGA5 TaxID=2583453 RepID=UPI0011249B7A|nr:PIN domain-containing protein [Ochrobactrum sp. CGA5]
MEHVFVADTNLFFECMRLEELPWSDLAVDPVVIALTKPVLAEIDKHKNGGGRTRKRAIEISGRIRGMLAALPPEIVIQEATPRVLLRLMPIVQPAPELASSLDYGINDDRIVGTVATLSKDETFASVKLLTDDSVAASTAQGLGVSFFLIPESWKRPPEQTTEAKRIRELEKEISIYRSQEPVISIANASDKAASANVVRRVALALEPTEIDRLIDKLKVCHPPTEDFAAPKPEIQADGTEISYEAPDAEAIGKYSSEAYPKWIDACRSIFESLHKGRVEPEAKVALTFGVANGGTRPALKMRVSFEAVGNIDLRRDADDSVDHEDRNDDDGQPELPPIPRLPAPPIAPAVRRIVKRSPSAAKGVDIATLRMPGSGLRISELEKASRGVMSGLGPQMAAMRSAQSMFDNLHARGALADLARGIGPMSDFMKMAEEHDRLHRSLIQPTGIARPTYIDDPAFRMPLMPEKHDPEGFYYDRWPKGKPTKRGALTCDLFRHQRGEEFFEIEVLFPDDGDVTGAVRCTVEAENLTKPVELLIPLSRKIEAYNLMVIADEMVEHCGR